MDFGENRTTLSEYIYRAQKELEKSKPGNERFRTRAFQRALQHSERMSDEKVTAVQRQQQNRKNHQNFYLEIEIFHRFV